MRRREFMAVVGGALAAWSRPVGAQEVRVPVIGYMTIGPAVGSDSRLDGFRSGLRDHGLAEGNNIDIEFRWAESPDGLPAVAAELVQRNVTLIVAGGNSATKAAKGATSKIPIVFSAADDPVRLGYVNSFRHPGGNMTGVSLISGALGAKRLETLRTVVPTPRVVAVLTDPKNPAEEDVRLERAAAREIGQKLQILEATTIGEIEQAFVTLEREKAEALIVNADALFTAQRGLVVRLAAHHRIPAIYAWREFPEAGGLMSYGTNIASGYRQLGDYVGRILKGERPGDLPIIQPTNFELVINLKAARELGVTIPPTLLARADEVIE